jgi:hypothetical protein
MSYSLTTPAQIDGFRLLVTIKAIEMYMKHNIKVSRNATPANLRAIATEYTGKSYPRSRKGLETALADLQKIRAAILS